MLQAIVTGLIVVAAFAYALWALMPGTWRARWMRQPHGGAAPRCDSCAGCSSSGRRGTGFAGPLAAPPIPSCSGGSAEGAPGGSQDTQVRFLPVRFASYKASSARSSASSSASPGR